MSDTEEYDEIPGRQARPECPDCYHLPHYRTECRECGCPSGIDRKRERDEAASGAKGDRARNPNPGFY